MGLVWSFHKLNEIRAFKTPFPCLVGQRKWEDTNESSRTRMNGRCEGTIGGPEGSANEDDEREARRLCRWHEVSVFGREKDRLLRGSTRPKVRSIEAAVVSVGAARSCSSSFSFACFSLDSGLRRK